MDLRPDVDWLAVLVAFVVSMAIGFGLYARPVLGERWMRLVGLEADKVRKEDATKAVLTSAVLSFVMVLGLATLVDWADAISWSDGALLGLLLWGAVAVPLLVTHLTFEQRPPALSLLYVGHHLLDLPVIGAILAGMSG